jgi:endonuclease III
MARGGSGAPRQPLSQRRPKAAASGAPKPAKAPTAGKASAAARSDSAPAKRRTVITTGQKPSQKAPPTSRAPRTVADKKRIATVVLEAFMREYPDAHCELDHTNAFELLCATILSAQCTDVRVNMVTPALFARYPDAAALAAARQEDVEEIVRTTGFFRSKAKNLIAMAGALLDRYEGEVPRTIADLVQLAGVGRKTANVILGNAFGINEGVVVDTHVQRLSRRLGLTREADAVAIERALMPLFPREHWALLSHLLIWHGRRVCDARKPRCSECVVAEVCPSRQ